MIRHICRTQPCRLCSLNFAAATVGIEHGMTTTDVIRHYLAGLGADDRKALLADLRVAAKGD